MRHWLFTTRDEAEPEAAGWDRKWTVQGTTANRRYYPARDPDRLHMGDMCVLQAYGRKALVARFLIASDQRRDPAGDPYFALSFLEVWTSPARITDIPGMHVLNSRDREVEIDESDFHLLVGHTVLNS